MPGRPFVAQGIFRTTTSRNLSIFPESCISDWNNVLKPTTLSKTILDEDLGRRWLKLAEAEHASVASFAKHTLQLMSIGAPSKLIEASQQASIDEIRHAQMCYGIASIFLGSEFGPGFCNKLLV